MVDFVSSEGMPAKDRRDWVQQIVSSTFVPMDVDCEDWTAYQGDMRSGGLGSAMVAVLDQKGFIARRTPELIEQADPNLMKLLLVCGGSAVVEQGGRQVALSGTQFTFYDVRRPYGVVIGDIRDRPTRAVTFMFSPSMLPLPPKTRDRLTAMRFAAHDGLGDLTSQFLVRLAQNIDQCSPAEAARLSTAAMEVLAVQVAHEMDADEWESPQARRRAMLTTVQAFVLGRLGDPDLSPRMVADAHHISLRTLHQLFHDEGLTVAGWIRQRRLERCRRDLADPALASRPVAAVAASWGFTNAPGFTRLFRAAHGMPPGEYRMSALAGK